MVDCWVEFLCCCGQRVYLSEYYQEYSMRYSWERIKSRNGILKRIWNIVECVMKWRERECNVKKRMNYMMKKLIQMNIELINCFDRMINTKPQSTIFRSHNILKWFFLLPKIPWRNWDFWWKLSSLTKNLVALTSTKVTLLSPNASLASWLPPVLHTFGWFILVFRPISLAWCLSFIALTAAISAFVKPISI